VPGDEVQVDRLGPEAGQTPKDRVMSLYGERMVPPLSEHVEGIAERLLTDSAVGLILVDASSLADIERLYGARPFRRVLEALAQRACTRVAKDFGQDFCMTSGPIQEEQLLFFLHRPRDDMAFYSHKLPLITRELRDYIGLCLHRIVYPYLIDPSEVPVGFGIAFHRPFQRPDTQIRRLIEKTLAAAKFEVERIGRESSAILERIILEETLTTVYEPIIELADHTVIGYEGLTRGPVGTGLERPQKLFQVAYRANLEYELDTLCRRLALRNARGIDPGKKLFLNILPTSIHDPDFSEMRIRSVLEEIGLAPQNLVLEISEREAIANFQIFREAMGHFLNLGCGIALDDIGSGYSSLETALELAPDYLKIDMSLVRGIDDNPPKQELLRGLQGLAEKLKAEVIAEGIETEEELDVIRELGIKCGQGYAIGRGAPFAQAAPSPDEE
jgi:EAL domain-containing protein (putative c-di-GMP-specific phosphodiesterase class I)